MQGILLVTEQVQHQDPPLLSPTPPPASYNYGKQYVCMLARLSSVLEFSDALLTTEQTSCLFHLEGTLYSATMCTLMCHLRKEIIKEHIYI